MHCVRARSADPRTVASPPTISSLRPRPGDERPLPPPARRCHQLGGVQGLAGHWTDVGQDHEPVPFLTLHRGERQTGREAQVGQRLPGRHQPLEVRSVAPRRPVLACARSKSRRP